MTVELRHLRAFLAVTEHGNFSRAATAIHVSQPALSRTIAQLEALTGVALVERTTHQCTVTDAGRRFASAARVALRATDEAVAAAAGTQRELVLGHAWAAGRFLAAIVRAWNASPRPCSLDVTRVDDRTAGLAEHIADAAILRGGIDKRAYCTVELASETRVAVLPADDPLAAQRIVRLRDLADGRLVTSTIGLTTAALWPAGARPRAALRPVGGIDDWLVAIAAGTGFGVSVASTAELHPHPDVRYVPLVDAPAVPVLLAYPRRGAHPSCDLLARVAGGAR